MSNKAKNIIVGAVAIANITTPIASLAHSLDEVNSINESSNTFSARISGNAVATEDINLRKTASWSGTVLQIIKKGEPVFISSTSNGWAKVTHDNQVGYVPEKYLQAASFNHTVTESVNLRKTASWSGDILCVIKKGSSVNVTSTSNGWSYVQYNGLSGYISSSYVTKSTGSSSNSSSSSSSSSSTTSKTVSGAVNLRETASWSGNVIHVIKSGDTVSVHNSTSGDFTKVTHSGKTGYIPTSYINKGTSGSTTTTPSTSTPSNKVESMNKTGKVINVKSGDTLNVRSGTNTSTSSLGKLSAGATVQITGRDKETGWYQINYNGKVGYVGDYYIEIVNTTTSTSGTLKKTTANLNMRSTASASGTLIMTIPQGSVVTVLSSSNGWDYVEYNGKKGYCSSSYLASTTITKYTTTNLNMRSGPSTDHSIVTTLGSNVAVEVLSTDANGWSKIKYNGKEGYVNSKYLTDKAGSSNLPSSKPAYSRVKVVIDPGHGGSDPGAIGFGRYEKDIALSISKKINANLKTLGFQTVMTRSTDVYIPLAQRYQIANNNNADLFVSVHLNSASESAYGIETLYKNSKTFASNIQTEMISATGARDRGLKHRSDLAVLNGTKMSAALVETGFISNSTESAKLATGSYQDTLAASISKGIAKYTDSNL